MSGYIGVKSGRLFVAVYSKTDVAKYRDTCKEIEVHPVDLNGRNY